ncbi:uncharacterized protein LOC113157120 [Anabas testudineus]|uniref:uncharacterized protein LOC113157120 n=1 Tax=Anabas testudineus TaxID=64144 RepID=UPI000E4570F2|nr:uncharacterized protein LOC113157120 [Anabas testudineus]
MSVNLAPNSRLLLVSVLVCAAVMCSASPIITQVDNEGKHNILRSLYMPYNRDPRLPTETGGQTGTNNKTETSGNFGEASSIIDHQSNLPQLSYDPDNKRSGTGIAQVWRGQSAGGMRPSNSIYTRQILDGPQPRVNYLTLNRKSYNYPPIIRKSSLKEAGSPFYQGVSQVWPPEYSYSPYNEAQDHIAGDKTVRKYSDSLLSPPTGVYWTARLPAPHYSGFKETNELTAAEVQSTSSRIQSGESLGLPSQTAPRALSISETLDASVVRSNPSPETLTPSIADLSQGVSSESTDKTQIYKKAKSYLFKDSQTSFHRHEATGGVAGDGARIFSTTPHEQEPSATRGYSRLSSNLRQIQQSHQNDPTKEVQLPPMNRPLYQNVVYYSAQTHSFRKYPPAATVSSAAQTPTQRPLYPASGTTLESFASMDNVDSQYSNDPSREKPVAGRPIDEPTKGSMHDYKPAQSTKTLYGFRGFESPARSAAKEPAVLSFSDGRSFRQYSFNKKQDYKFKMANMHSSLSPTVQLWTEGSYNNSQTCVNTHITSS